MGIPFRGDGQAMYAKREVDLVKCAKRWWMM